MIGRYNAGVISAPTQTFFVDESGNNGLSREPSGQMFVLAAVTGPSAERIRFISNAIREGFISGREFKWKNVRKEIRPRIIQRIGRTPLRYFAVVIDIPRLKREFPEEISTSNSMYKHAFEVVCREIESQYPNSRTDFIVDGQCRKGIEPVLVRVSVDFRNLPQGSTQDYQDHTYTLRAPFAGANKTARTVIFKDSKADLGIQLADFIAGGIRSFAIGKQPAIAGVWKGIEGKLVFEPFDHPEGTAIHTSLASETTLTPGMTQVKFPGDSFRLE